MRRHRRRSLTAATVLVALHAALMACSPGGGGNATSGVTSAAPAPASPDRPAEPIGVSPGGVTTRVDVPAESTEEQYAQACMATKSWLESRGGDPTTLVEAMLKELQTSTRPSPQTFNKTWAELTVPQQAAVIIAVRAATEGGC